MIVKDKNNNLVSIGNYTILKLLSISSFSYVYKVEDRITKKIYALKILTSNYNLRRINDEVGILKILNDYPYSLKFERVEKISGKYIFLFQFANGGSLKEYIKLNGKLSSFTTLYHFKSNILKHIW